MFGNIYWRKKLKRRLLRDAERRHVELLTTIIVAGACANQGMGSLVFNGSGDSQVKVNAAQLRRVAVAARFIAEEIQGSRDTKRRRIPL